MKISKWIIPLVLGIVILIPLAVGLFVRNEVRSAQVRFDRAIKWAGEVQLQGINEHERIEMQTHLAMLKVELGSGLFQLSQKLTNSTLMTLALLYFRDEKLTKDEYEEWTQKYNERTTIDGRQFYYNVRKLAKDSGF